MIAFTTFFSLAIIAPLLTVSGVVLKTSPSACSVKSLTTPNLPAPLAAPSTPASWVGLAIGTQNYTCSSAGTYTNVGALAELFDISCLIEDKNFAKLPDLAIHKWKVHKYLSPGDVIVELDLTTSSPILGYHYYVPNPITGVGLNPEWDFTSGRVEAGKVDAFVIAAKVNGTSAPTGSQDIDWVQLGSLTGKLAKQVYRTDTRLGQPPTSCTPGSPEIEVKYVAKYYGFGGSI